MEGRRRADNCDGCGTKCNEGRWEDDAVVGCSAYLCVMFPFRKLRAWQEAHALTVRVYRATKGISDIEFPDLRRQICRSALSVASNIAEGAGRDTQTQFAHFLETSIASANELDYQLFLAIELGALRHPDSQCLPDEVTRVRRIIVSLRKAVKRRRYRAEGNRGSRDRD